MKLLRFPSRLRHRYQDLFYLEQWTALFIGMVCLGVSVWAGMASFRGSAIVHHFWFSVSAWATIEGMLTVAVAFIGTALVRFAFYKPGRKTPAAPVYVKPLLPEEDTESDSSASSTLVKPFAMCKRRG